LDDPEALASLIFRTLTSAAVSLDRLDLGELIASVEDFLARLVESDDIVPPLRRVDEVRLVGVATEMDRDTAVVVSLCGHVVDRIRVVLVLLEVEVTIVDGD
jgi:hypothetical protein